ncbi:MAG: endonuclease/exonuclease/phosphatase family protein [Romboutsia sp.]
MVKPKKTIIIILTIIVAIATTIFMKYISTKKLSLYERKIYNLYKSEDMSISSKSDKLTDVTSLKILSYNIHRGKDQKGNYTLDEISKFLNESDADIICLQEVLSSQHTLIRESGKYKSQFVANIEIPIASTGLGTYSKYPILESNHIKLSSKDEQRGALHTVYRIDGQLINVINVHLGLDKKERRKQIEEVLEYTKNLEGEIILVGDFNETTVEIEELRDVGKYHGYKNNGTFISTNSRIDYIFMTTEDVYSIGYKIIDTYLSDHYPIMATIRYKP